MNADLESTQQAIAAQKQKIAALKQKLNNIRVIIPKRSEEDKLALQEQQTRAGAEAIMPFDPKTGMDWLQTAESTGIRREQVQDKRQQTVDLATNRKIATDRYNEAVKAWSVDKEDPAAQNSLLDALGQARIYGLSLVNPLSNYTQEKQFASTASARVEENKQKREEWNKSFEQSQKQFDENNTLAKQKASQDAYFAQQQLDLNKSKLALAENKSKRLDGAEAQAIEQLELAEPIIQELESMIARDAATYGLIQGITSPNAFFSSVANSLATEKQQRAAHAYNQVQNMVGRQLSGAAISQHEWSAFQNNLPKLGDTPEVLKQKAAFRSAWVSARKNRGVSDGTNPDADTGDIQIEGWK